MLSDGYRQVVDAMMKLENDGQKENLSRFFKTGKGEYGYGDLFLGIKVPQTRQVVKEYWKKCNLDDVKELLVSQYHELRLCSLLILVRIFKHAGKDSALRKQCVAFYLSRTEYINNWDLVDLSCYEILGTWFSDKEKGTLYDLARNGRTIWENRIAMVSCIQFVRNGEFSDCMHIADILLHHKHDLIHKAVGWLLRDVGERDAVLLRTFLLSPADGECLPRYKSMPRTTLRYAIEKFPEEERLAYLKGTAI